MSIKIPFVKMQGLGNDFVIIEQKFIPKHLFSKEFVKNIADRRIGIGCDQLIIYQTNIDETLMHIYNQDGSSALACGNATRCLMRLLFDESGISETIINIQGRLISARYIDVHHIEINMGEVDFSASWMPQNTDLWTLAARYMIEPKELVCVDVANPHLVIFTKISEQDQYVIGRDMQNNELFPNGINVNFATIAQQEINLRVWERGVGFTYACGSGAVASFAGANRLGFIAEKAIVNFQLGSLQMNKVDKQIFMVGGARYVFKGNYLI